MKVCHNRASSGLPGSAVTSWQEGGKSWTLGPAITLHRDGMANRYFVWRKGL